MSKKKRAKKEAKGNGIPEYIKNKEKPTYSRAGQSAPRRKINVKVLNDNEMKVLGALKKSGEGLSIIQLARTCFGVKATKNVGGTRGYVAVKNALRRLVVGSFARKIDHGTYAPVKS